MEERVIRLHECFSRTGAFVFQLYCQKAIMTQSGRGGWVGDFGSGGGGVKTLYFPVAHVDRKCTAEHTRHDAPHTLLAAVVH